MFNDQNTPKLAVAKAHIETAVLLAALSGDARSVHLLVMAAEELIGSYARATGKSLKLDIDQMIRPERLKEWNFAKKKAYNYFKHADRDAESSYDGPEKNELENLNQLTIVQAAVNLPALGVQLAPHVGWAWRAAIVAMPSLIDWDKLPAQQKDAVDRAGGYMDAKLANAAILSQAFANDSVLAGTVQLAIDAQHLRQG